MERKLKELLSVTDDDIRYLAYGIGAGTTVGLMLGFFISNPPLGFSLGGVLGIIVSGIYSIYKKLVKIKKD
ncbi:hypothetical protein [Clostridium folliculivorans]|uniref:Uncharacterized protein n=1 Tax=Clostridium folliculivorans TaxID=2886038 RepID=A0A9W6DBA7_9CLOT|nr:hypothetical protein [Clostridium folliculivorans]GKU26069.1 hypothetical protein CFOLD11_28960 [Clostridium folliculivorans]GKU28155.1 hypothetical protein CFB3_02610 [Clostridium folliculivorans]